MLNELVILLRKSQNEQCHQSAKFLVMELKNFDGKNVHKIGLEKMQDLILELVKIFNELGKVGFEHQANVDHPKSELIEFHCYEACLDQLKQKNRCRNGVLNLSREGFALFLEHVPNEATSCW